ncbi:MAG: MFS transporter [Kofleriaceae bacterium]|nr:MFS transporter [Kofleriaceae bacterium]
MPRARLDGRVYRMTFARAVNTMGLSLVMTFLAIYVVETRGYPAWLYGVIALVGNIGQSLANAWAGNLSDRIGRMPLITGSLFLRSIVIAILGTQILFGAPLWTIALNIIVSSSLRGGFEPVAYALVADVVGPDQRIAAFGLQRMGINFGWAIGPAMGGVLTLVIPYGAVFYVAAVSMIVAGLVVVGLEDPVRSAPQAPEPRGALWRSLVDGVADRQLRLLLLGTFLGALMQTQMFGTLSIYLTDELGLTSADVGLLYTINGAGVLLLQMPALRLLQHTGLRRTLPYSSFLESIGFALIGAGTGFAGAAVAMMIITSAEVVFSPAHQAAIAESGDPARRGRTFGIVGFAQMFGVAAAPLVGGVLLDTIGDHHLAVWLSIATIGCAQTLCFVAFVRQRDGRAISASAAAGSAS